MTPLATSMLLPASRRDRVITNARAVTRIDPADTMTGDIFCFGRCRLVVRERLLWKDDALVSIGGRAFDLLLALLEHAGETVDNRELFERMWPDVIVSPVNLRVHVAGLRKALGDGQDGNRFVISVPGRGYRFVAPVECIQSAVPAEAMTKRMFIREAVATNFDSAVCFVDLAGINDPAHVARSVAAALGCEAEPSETLSCVLGYLRDKKMLLALDNCEHVLAGVAQLMERLFTEAPRIQFLIGK